MIYIDIFSTSGTVTFQTSA